MSKVDRKLFVPRTGYAYNDAPQVIGFGATISAPHMVGDSCHRPRGSSVFVCVSVNDYKTTTSVGNLSRSVDLGSCVGCSFGRILNHYGLLEVL